MFHVKHQRKDARVTTPTKGRMRIGPALAIAILLGVSAIAVSVKGTNIRTTIPSDDDLHENITLSVVFKPTPRVVGVDIQAHVEGVPVVNEKTSASPWNRVVRVPKGVPVSLYAFQPDNSWMNAKAGSLDCVISSKDGTLSHAHRDDAGSVRCYVNRVGG